ncbi:hypothetical protein [Methylosinus sp. Sm6]|uniref:hypothetical protein n=1 Tax=Methylosinus sp. Sm6 TaxID=2866948 RepID=UPI001C9A1D2F|nr:hypothetical protein [Methylosinus sp. Sm6]MBY6239674.1 hypothetical protein [Methylosinus sp. Sm6]
MPFSRLAFVIAAGLLAGACNTTSDLERRSADEARCRSYGFKPGAEGFAKCLLQLDLDRSADRRARYDYPYVQGPRGWGWNRGWW